MKKFINVFAAMSVFVLMFTACGSQTPTGDDVLIDIIPDAEITDNTAGEITVTETEAEIETDTINESEADTKTEVETDVESEVEADAETEVETEAEPFEVSAFYTSIEEFAVSDDIFSIPAGAVNTKDSYTYSFMRYFEDSNGFYIGIERFESINDISEVGEKFSVASVEDKLAMIFSDDEDDAVIIIKDGMLYIVNNELRIAAYGKLGEQGIRSSAEQMVEEFISIITIENEVFYGPGTASYKVNIGGETYTFEHSEYIGMLYDQEGILCLKINKKPGAEYFATRVNEFSADVPDGIFDIPSDYKMIDMFEDE